MAKALVGLALGLWLFVPTLSAAPSKTDPTWGQLTPQQQQILAPIQGEWAELDAPRKQKWLGIAKRYPTMKPGDQARLQRRMREWVSLTPEQRHAARARFREFEQMTPDDRQAVREKWEAYQRKRTEDARQAEEARRAAETARSETGGEEPVGTVPGAAGLRPQ